MRSAASTQRAQRTAIERYIGEIEPIRLAVNKLLGGADPILEALHDRRIAPGDAARRIGGEIAPSPDGLNKLLGSYGWRRDSTTTGISRSVLAW
jgi:hypothetical protein